MRDWIIVNGRKLLWESFIRSLDNYRGDSIIWKKGDAVRSQYCRMICPLQKLIAHYHKGKDAIDDWLEKYMVDDGVTVPVEKKLPEAIEIVFNQIQECIQVDLSKLLDECVIDSVRTYERIQEEIRKENERIETIRSLPVSHESFKEKDVIGASF